jgi:Zn-dependent peptidase ImmA (M78 family)/transcriptional regulator with XRE-family HTH domain
MAARSKAMVEPSLLVWARTSAGFSVLAAAEKIGVDQGVLSAWEAPGDDGPSIPQLRKLAGLYKRPLAVFYLPEPPKDFQAIRDLRRLPGTGMRFYSPELELEMRRARERRGLVVELAEELEVRPKRLDLRTTIQGDPEAVGVEIREKLRVSLHDQATWRDTDGRAAFRAWRERIEGCGALVFQATRIESREASGFAIAEKLLPVIVVNQKDAPTRRTFSLLHELAHLMLHISGVSDLETDAARPPEDQALEVFCNRVAAAALMPREGFLQHHLVAAKPVSRAQWTDDEISELARSFNVSREAALRRLLVFGYTTEAFYRRKKQQYDEEYAAAKARQKARADEVRRNMPQEIVSNLGRPLVTMVLAHYHQDRLTLSDVAGYLGIKAKHVPKVELMARMG